MGLLWRKIPIDAEYFVCDGQTSYCVRADGLVVEERFLSESEVNLDKAIWPTIQGNRAYIRLRRKGVDKKFQLVRILAELFPELGGEIVILTRKGPWSLSVAPEPAPAKVAPRVRAPRESGAARSPRRESGVGGRAGAPPERSEGAPVEVSESEDAFFDADDEDLALSMESRTCKVCNLKKRVSEFSPREDMCLDCYMGRDELLKEIIAKKKRKAKYAAPRVVEEGDDSAAMDDGLEALGKIAYGISMSD